MGQTSSSALETPANGTLLANGGRRNERRLGTPWLIEEVRLMPSPVLVAVGLVRDPQGRLLVGQRPDGRPLAGYDEFPGGKVEPGEEPSETVVREVFEETGLRVTPTALRLSTEHEYGHGRVRLFFFDCEMALAEIPPHKPFRWERIADLRAESFPTANQAVIESLRQSEDRPTGG